MVGATSSKLLIAAVPEPFLSLLDTISKAYSGTSSKSGSTLRVTAPVALSILSTEDTGSGWLSTEITTSCGWPSKLKPAAVLLASILMPVEPVAPSAISNVIVASSASLDPGNWPNNDAQPKSRASPCEFRFPEAIAPANTSETLFKVKTLLSKPKLNPTPVVLAWSALYDKVIVTWLPSSDLVLSDTYTCWVDGACSGIVTTDSTVSDELESLEESPELGTTAICCDCTS